MSELFDDIDALLEEHAEKRASLARLRNAEARGRFEKELWAAIRPFVQSEADFRAAAAFMAHMTRAHARD